MKLNQIKIRKFLITQKARSFSDFDKNTKIYNYYGSSLYLNQHQY